jgi:hypothetical protein
LESNLVTNHNFLEDDESDPSELENNTDEIDSKPEAKKFILIEKLEKYIFSPGTITWKRNLVLTSPGDLLDHKYFEKFKKLTDRLPCDYVLNPINISKFVDMFEDLKNAKKFKTKNRIRLKILKWFKVTYWQGNKKSVLAELMEAAHEVFFDLPIELDQKLKNSNIDIFRVYSLKSSLLVSFAVALGIVDFQYLKDLYHLPFFFNIGLKQPLSYNHVEALKYEWSNKGAALEYLKQNNVNDIEINIFKNNTIKSLEIYKKYYHSKRMSNGIFQIFSKFQERPNGQGLSQGLKYNELSDIESLVVYVAENFGIQDINPTKNDYLNKLNTRLLEKSTLSKRLRIILEDVFNELDEAEELLLGA